MRIVNTVLYTFLKVIWEEFAKQPGKQWRQFLPIFLFVS